MSFPVEQPLRCDLLKVISWSGDFRPNKHTHAVPRRPPRIVPRGAFGGLFFFTSPGGRIDWCHSSPLSVDFRLPRAGSLPRRVWGLSSLADPHAAFCRCPARIGSGTIVGLTGLCSARSGDGTVAGETRRCSARSDTRTIAFRFPGVPRGPILGPSSVRLAGDPRGSVLGYISRQSPVVLIETAMGRFVPCETAWAYPSAHAACSPTRSGYSPCPVGELFFLQVRGADFTGAVRGVYICG